MCLINKKVLMLIKKLNCIEYRTGGGKRKTFWKWRQDSFQLWLSHSEHVITESLVASLFHLPC
jgi:hypothetical protein